MANNNTQDPKKLMAILGTMGLSLAAMVSGAFLVAPSEGMVNGTYLDPINIVTACYGYTGPELKLGQKFTQEQCLRKLADRLDVAEQGVDRVIKVPINTYQKAALISFTYNVGEGNLSQSTLAKQFNQKQYDKGCDSLLGWVYANKKKLAGLEARRKLERQMCLGQIGVANVSTN